MRAIPGIILAGGQARRMGGGDKGLLKLRGESLLERVIARLGPQVSEIAINANGDSARFSSFGFPVIPDSISDFPGPLAGVLAGMDWAAEKGAASIVTVAADTPFFPVDLAKQLDKAAQSKGKPIALAATPHPERGMMRQPTFGLWPVDLRDDLRRSLNDGVRKIVAWTDSHGTALAEFETNPFDPFFNVNTPADLDLAKKLLLENQS